MNINAILSYILPSIPWLIVIDVALVGLILYNQNLIKAALSWPSVAGKVVESRISRPSDTAASPWVFYSYAVNGRSYKYSAIYPGEVSESGDEYAKRIVARYPVGTEVTVYYNPKNPEQAYLEKKAQIQSQLWIYLIVVDLALPFIIHFISR